jgi:hypothetical protein
MSLTPLEPLPPPPLLAETERLRAAKHNLCNEIEDALDRFTKQTGLSVYSLDLELLSSTKCKLCYLVRPNVPL